MVRVSVYYSMNLTAWGEWESALGSVAERYGYGGVRDGGGTNFDRNERVVYFLFPTEEDARTFSQHVRGWSGLKFRVELPPA